MRVVCVRLQKQTNSMHAIAEACLQFTPMIALREREALFLEIGGCRKLYTEETLYLRLQVLLRRFQTTANVTFANSAPHALALARYSPRKPCSIANLPLVALLAFALPFHDHVKLIDELKEVIRKLKQLGLLQLKEFMALPAKQVSGRFGALGSMLQQRLQDSAELSWPLFIPEKRLLEAIRLEDSQACETLEPLFFYLRPLVDRSMARLRGLGGRATQIALTLEVESYKHVKETTERLVVDLHLPQGSSRTIMQILREHLYHTLNKKPLSAPLVGLSFEVTKRVACRTLQRHFFHHQEEQEEDWNALLARLWQRLGSGRAFFAQAVARYLPEAGWQKVFHKFQDLSETPAMQLPYPKRPLRLLPKPQPIHFIDSKFIYRKKNWQICGWQGPERLVGEWWRGEFARDYYRIHTQLGEQLWVFVDANNNYFLHGYFD